MIEANELRIGNWVLSRGQFGFWYNSRVSKLSNKEIIVGVGFKREVKPIELTEEILLKLGFKLANTKTRCYQKPNSQTLYFSDEGASMSTGIPMKYLHELQNRVKSMTGKELEIEL